MTDQLHKFGSDNRSAGLDQGYNSKVLHQKIDVTDNQKSNSNQSSDNRRSLPSLIYLYSLRSLGPANHRQQQCEAQGPAVNRHSIESMWPISRNVSNQRNQYNHPNQSNPRDIWAARQPPASYIGILAILLSLSQQERQYQQ